MKENLTDVKNEEMQAVKLNKKGFSLVELIVVIAIMAILLGAVGMQVLPYIEKSRQSKDMQVISGLCTAANSAFAQNAANVAANSAYTITSDSAGGDASAPADGGGTKVIESIKTLLGGTSADKIYTLINGKMESKVGKTLAKVTITFNGNTDGSIIVTASDGSKDILDPVSAK